MPPVLLILSTEDPESPDLSLARIAQFLGLQHRIISLNDLKNCLPCSRDTGIGTRLYLAFSYSTLVKAYWQGRLDDLEIFLKQNSSCTLVYCVNPANDKNGALAKVTGNAINNVSSFNHNAYEYKICQELSLITKEFTGLSFGPINNKYDFTFDTSDLPASAESIISVNNEPLFVRLTKDGSETFLLAVGEILDIQAPLEQPLNTENHFSRIVPVMMFLKYAFGDYCWHPKERQACLVIDDPLLKKKYGFLEYGTLLSLMREKNFVTSIGFIPWNYRRTSKETALLFRDNGDKFSISVHGCNHTKHEFALTDTEDINSKIKLSTERMIFHSRSHGLKFDRIMVFPQGVFSAKCMSVLKANNFLAAVNTEAVSVDTTLKLKICDFMKPAIMDYDEFPLFLRRYPCSIPDYAFDLFLGRPLIIVIHHDYLKDGYFALINLINQINAIDHKIKWNSLGTIIEHSYWQRATLEDSVHVEVYAGKAKIQNISDRKLKYVISKNENQNVPISEVRINGSPVGYQVNGGGLFLIRELEADEAIDFEVIYQDIYGPSGVKKDGGIQSQKTRLRRYLSEIRDNILYKNDLLITTAHRIRRLVS